MDRARFSSAVAEARRRVRGLTRGGREEAGSVLHRPHAVLLRELEDALEELLAAEAELLRQDVELFAAVGAVEAERNRYRELFELMPSGYLVLDRRGVILEVNHAAQALVGYRAAELVQRPLPCIVATGGSRLRDAISDLRHGRVERVEELEVELAPRGAPPIPAVLTLTVARDDRDRIVGVRALVCDVREHRRAEEAARAARAASAANVAKDEFLATLSHELRNPLNAILGWTQILRDERDFTGPASSAVEGIERNGLHLNRLVDDLLDVSRILKGKLAFDMKPCDLATAAADAIDAVWASLVTRGLHLRATVGETCPVVADAARLRQAIVNLLSNAIKFSPAGGAIDLAVTCTASDFRIAVRDAGCGIEPALLPHVFERFRQGRASDAHPNQGLGLGLAIVREIVAHHGGTVWAQSEGEGRGACFTMAIPLVRPAAEKAPAARPAHAEPHGASLPLHGLHFLALATPRGSPNGLCAALASAGAEVERSHSIADAVDRARTLRPNAVVVEAKSNAPDAVVPLARAVESCFGGDLPLVVCAPRRTGAGGWHDLDANLQIYLTARPEPAMVVSLLGTLARLGGAGVTRALAH